jgi:uncharacterized protein YbjQ (UPF0145 family)
LIGSNTQARFGGRLFRATKGETMNIPTTLSKNTLKAEVRSMIEDAKALPADGVIYTRGDIQMTHKAQTSMRVEQVLVNRYGQTWRSLKTGKGWSRVDEIGGQI